MMRPFKQQNILFVLLGMVLLGGLAYVVLQQKPKTNWEQHYREKSEDPYGTSVLYGLLSKRADSLTNIQTDYLSFLDQHSPGDTHANIVLINRYAFLSDTEATRLMKWTEAGNKVFMATESIPGELIRKLYQNECNQEWEGLPVMTDSVIRLNFSLPSQRDSAYVFQSPYEGPHAQERHPIKKWKYYDSRYLCDEALSVVEYGYIESGPDSGYYNFVFIPYGKGGFYFHTNPILFSNYYLRDYRHLDYASKVFQHLHNGPIYFDEFHKSYFNTGDNSSEKAGPLRYILSQPSLRYAWYLLLFMAFLYLAFRAKRKQKPITVLEERKNTSLEYYKTVGSLYFQQKDPYKISLLMFKLFRMYVKGKYGISIRTNDEHTVRLLSARSQIEEDHIRRLLTLDRYVHTRPAISPEDVVTYYQKLNYFYLNSQ